MPPSAGQHQPGGAGDDPEIPEERPPFQVLEVIPEPLGEVGVAPQAVDLGPTGHPWLNVVPQVVVRDDLLEAVEIDDQLIPVVQDYKSHDKTLQHIAALVPGS